MLKSEAAISFGRSWMRPGYSLLELMLAMSLLAGLLAVGWSLLGTYRDAEQRGWKLAARTQTIRSAREWLENDMAHLLVISARPSSGNSLATVNIGLPEPARQNRPGAARLLGTSTSLSALVAPSVDPFPFLERLILGPREESIAGTTSSPLNADNFQPGRTRVDLGLWPPEWLMIEYRLIPAADNEPTDARDSSELWTLVRREMIDRNLWTAMQPRDAVEASEPELTIADLYDRSESSGPIQQPLLLNESRLFGLSKPRFSYYDGSQWAASWDSLRNGQYPRAVCLEFDLVDQSISRRTGAIAEVDQDALEEFDFLNSPWNSEPPAVDLESGMDGAADGPTASPRDVRIVVHLNKAGSTATAGSNRGVDFVGGGR